MRRADVAPNRQTCFQSLSIKEFLNIIQDLKQKQLALKIAILKSNALINNQGSICEVTMILHRILFQNSRASILPLPITTTFPLYRTINPFSKRNPNKKQINDNRMKKTYNIDVDESKIPPHLLKAYKAKKEAFSYQVPSEAELNDKMILERVIEQRQQIQNEKGSQRQEVQKGLNKDVKEQSLLQKISCGVVVLNYLVSGILLGTGKIKLFGLYMGYFGVPSLFTISAISIGINFANLITRQGLNMFTPRDQLKSVSLTQAPASYYLEMMLILAQATLIPSLAYPQFFQLLMTKHYFSLFGVMITVPLHSWYQNLKIGNPVMKNNLHATCYCLMLLLMLVSVMSIYFVEGGKQFIEGLDERQKIWMKKPKELEDDGKITQILEQQGLKEEGSGENFDKGVQSDKIEL